MKNLFQFLVVFVLGSMIIFSSCKDDTVEPTVSEFEVLTTHMAQNNLDFADFLSGWVIAGSGLTVDQADYSVSDYFVIDLRSATDFADGHIKDAVNSTLGDILTTAEQANGKDILVVCYTGQTAGRGVGALRLMGYNAKSLKWGMSGWHSDFAGKWNSNATDINHQGWTTSGEPVANGTFSNPTFTTGLTTGAEILESRVKTMLQKSDWGVSKTAVLDSPDSYFINNKWPIESWNEYGHIDGAYRIDEDLSLNGLKYLDPGKTIVTYCYTGQTSAITNMWLDVMGYNTKSLSFGANGIIHSKLLTGAAGSAPKKSWKGSGSGSESNYGYWNSAGDFFGPE